MDDMLRKSVDRLLSQVRMTHEAKGEPLPQWAAELEEAAKEPTEVKVTLPEELMLGIEAIAKDRDLPARTRFTSMMIATMGGCLFQEATFLDGTKLLIPQEQWERLCQAFIDLDQDRIAAVNYGLSFMNSGPSSYKEETNDQPDT